MSEQKSSGKKAIIVILGLLLVASVAGNVFQFFNTKEIIHEREVTKLVVDSLTIRKERLEAEFNASIAQLDQYKGENAEMDSLLKEAYAKIEQQRSKISYLIGQNQDYQILQQRMVEMRETVAVYEKEIQRLKAENDQLRTENTDLLVKVDQTSNENKDLKGKVDVASKLKVNNMSLKGLSVTNGGKEKPTDKASKTERISINYTLDENPLAETGQHTLYFRIVNPEGFVLADAGQSVKKFKSEKGDEIAYSRSVTVNYDGTKLTKSITWDQDAFNSGTYKVEVYIDGYFAGSEKLSLY
jgi:hypothetical protein